MRYTAKPKTEMATAQLRAKVELWKDSLSQLGGVGKRISLTAEGCRFLERLGHLLQGSNIARQELTDSRQLQVGEVRLGFAPMFGMGHLPGWLEGFHSRNP